MPSSRTVGAEELRAFCTAILEQVQMPPADAATVADTLVEADLRGVESHGVSRLPGYVRALRLRNVNPRPNVQVIVDSPANAVIDGDDGMGQVVSAKAMQLAIEKAAHTALAAVGVRNSSHCGALAYYTLMGSAKGMITFATCNAPAVSPPYGGITPRLSTNPICFAVPAGRRWPIVVDMATTTVARGKLRLAVTEGRQSIPRDWAIDAMGEPTVDPAAAMAGFLQWMGGPKGYGLAVIAEVLSAVLTGGLFGRGIPPLVEPYGTGPIKQNGFYLTLNVASFMPLAHFADRVDQLIDDLKSSEPARGVDRIYSPGEPEFERKSERLAVGIPLGEGVWRELSDLGASFGVSDILR